MIALIVLIGDELFEAYESRLLDIMDPSDGDLERRKDVRMLEKEEEIDWKREVRILPGVILRYR
jgi:hypothetical protein